MTQQTRRRFLKTSAATLAAGGLAPYWFTGQKAKAFEFQSKNDRPVIGCIGTGSRWGAVGPQAGRFGDVVAVCDVDKNHAERAKARFQGKPDLYEDYRKVLDRDDIDVVTVVTPDHWHSKIAIEAMQAGKDVYCEKPLTLTIEEGKQIRQVLDETKRVFQVGTQQRSEMGLRFLHAVAIIREGRIGELKKATCAIGGSPTSGPLPVVEVPNGLNWEMWQGQTPLTDYRAQGRKTRCHYEFRWWYEYSGGKMTDWGAHHVDIAQWGLDQLGEGQGPNSIDPLSVKHPVPYKDGYPTDDTQYNAATQFTVAVGFPGGQEMVIRETAKDLGFDNGIMFEGTEGRIFVNRGKLTGKAVDDLKDKPLKPETITALYKGKEPGSHMGNFFECLKTREQPVSDVHSHHRALTTCHLANIAIRLGRKLTWDPKTEQIVGDSEANAWQAREQREGYAIKV